MELSQIISRIEILRARIETQILAPSRDMNEEEKLSIEARNSILRSWMDELEKIEDELRTYINGDIV